MTRTFVHPSKIELTRIVSVRTSLINHQPILLLFSVTQYERKRSVHESGEIPAYLVLVTRDHMTQ